MVLKLQISDISIRLISVHLRHVQQIDFLKDSDGSTIINQINVSLYQSQLSCFSNSIASDPDSDLSDA